MMFKACIIIAAAASFCLVSSLETADKVSVRSHNMTKTIMYLMKIVEESNSPYKTDVQVKNNHCDCQGLSCECCVDIMGEPVCVKITFIPSEVAIDIQLTFDGNVVLDEKISAKNPPPICVSTPFIALAKLCLGFHDLAIEGNRFHACIDFQIILFGAVIEKFDLGCFDIPPSEMKWVKGTQITRS